MLSELRNKLLLALFNVLLLSGLCFGQELTFYNLPSSLDEVSGLEWLNDSLMVAFNDGGNKPELFVLNEKGVVQKKVKILDVKNKDWEDITSDGEYLYIGDIGNNSNKRKKLKILKVEIKDVLNKKEVKAEEISFKYKEQKSFPPVSDSLFYDAEAMTYRNDSLWIFTKNRSTDTDGYSWIYKVPTTPGNYSITHSDKVFIGKGGWLIDGLTAADAFEDRFYFLTYDRYIIMDYINGSFKEVSSYKFDRLAQRESILAKNKNVLFVADEKNPLVGEVVMYRIRLNRD